MTETTAKRFIAGAVCPACSEMDKIQMWNVDNVPHRECVACGYADTGRAFREAILARGGSQAPMVLFVNFRGREPSIDALLRHLGLSAEAA